VRATLDHFEIPITDLERVSRFLESVFGWTPEADVETTAETAGGERAPERYRRLLPSENPSESPRA
jgi:predicted enzyme related to lactoylglutathione lyase